MVLVNDKKLAEFSDKDRYSECVTIVVGNEAFRITSYQDAVQLLLAITHVVDCWDKDKIEYDLEDDYGFLIDR